MQLVHKQGESIAELKAQAKELEAGGKLMDAVKTYQRILKRDPHHIDAYNRIMVLYRKQKLYKEEAAVIDEAVRHFLEFYAPKSIHSAAVKRLSGKINKAFGMVDRKGNSFYEPGPVAAWNKRKHTLEKRMAAVQKKK